jgi:hypothetical protein
MEAFGTMGPAQLPLWYLMGQAMGRQREYMGTCMGVLWVYLAGCVGVVGKQ